MYKPRNIGPKIRQSLLAGETNRHISKSLDVSPATVSYHARKLGLEKTPRPTYDWQAIQLFMDAGHTFSDVQKTFGMSAAAISKAKYDGRIKYKTTSSMTAEEFSKSIKRRATSNDRKQLRKKMLREGLIYECNECKITEWKEKKISLELDHIDGDSSNNRLANLRLLCPNCHSQTSTWRGRNAKRYRLR